MLSPGAKRPIFEKASQQLEHSAFRLTNWLDGFSRLIKAVEAEAVREPCCFDQRR